MGPITLFDKSFLQSLSVDESVWFDHFFYTAICPIFYVETLADLKKPNLRRSAEEEVGIIADKFPQMHSLPTPNHLEMAIGNLLGQDVPFTGQIPIRGGRPVKSGEHTGVVYEAAPEAEAFRRWQRREFDVIEHKFASDWREKLQTLDLKSIADGFQQLGISGRNCQSLEEAKSIADAFVNRNGQPFEWLQLAYLFLDVPREYHELIMTHWSKSNCPPLAIYAPYAAYVLTIDVFFQIAIAANHISSDRASNRLDIAYLYYLPFCQVFVSGDKLHRKCASLFMRDNQRFVWAQDLKCALSTLDTHFSSLRESEKVEGVMYIAPQPPIEFESIVSQLWDEYLPTWREHANEPRKKPDTDPRLVKELTDFNKAPTLQAQGSDFDLEDADMISIRRKVRKKKGKWWQLPQDLKTDEGENQP